MPRVTLPVVGKLPTIWSNANLKDVMPHVLASLSWSMLQPLVSTILYAPCQAVGHVLPEGMGVMRRFSGRAYFDLTTMLWSYCDTLGLQSHEVTRGMGGHQPEIPAPSPHPLRGRVGLRRIGARLPVSWLPRQARRATAAREAGKSTLVALLKPIRTLVLEVGRRMVAAHLLEQEEDIFFLTWADLLAFFQDEWDGQGARALVADRQEQHATWLAEHPADVFLVAPDGPMKDIACKRVRCWSRLDTALLASLCRSDGNRGLPISRGDCSA